MLFEALGITEKKRSFLLEQYATPHSKFVRILNNDIHVTDEGSGPVIVMIHGFASSIHTWNSSVDILKKNYRVVRFDMPPFGLSGPLRDAQGQMIKMSVPLYRQVVVGVLDALGIEKAFFVGNSMGGLLGWDMAVEHPQRVQGVVVSDAVGFPQPFPIYIRLFTYRLLNQLAPHTLPTPVLKMAIRDVYGDKRRIKEDTVRLYLDLFMQKANRTGIAYMIDVLTKTDFQPERLKQLKCPMLVSWGEKDRWVPFSCARDFMNMVPHAELVTYPGVGHIPMEEIPEAFTKDVMTFIQKHLV